MPFKHRLRVRWGECDQQGVVFNPNYMVYMDDAAEVWLSSFSPNGDLKQLGWEYMVVRSTIEWHDSARHADELDIDVGIARYGNTSFDPGYMGKVSDRVIFRARSVCVSVASDTFDKVPIPRNVRDALGDIVTWELPP